MLRMIKKIVDTQKQRRTHTCVLVLYHHPAAEDGRDAMFQVDRAVIAQLRSSNLTVRSLLFSGEDALRGALDERWADVIFNLCDGFEDNERTAQVADLLEELGVPYTGCDGGDFRRATNKAATKLCLARAGLATPRGQVLKAPGAPLAKALRFPLIVKPCADDSSIGIGEDSVVASAAQLRKKLRQLFADAPQPYLAEEYIAGREIYVSIVGGRAPFPLLEVEFAQDFFAHRPRIQTYQSKWRQTSHAWRATETKEARLDKSMEGRIRRMARAAFCALSLRGYASMDVRIRGDDVFILELNPNPHIGPDSDMVKAANLAGLAYPQFLKLLVDQALKDAKKVEVLKVGN